MRFPTPKALCLTLFLLCNVIFLLAQPQAIPYQAVARNNAGIVIASQNIGLRFSIRDVTATGTIVYRETHTATTNSLGLFTANIGLGTATTGTFNTIDWSNGTKFLQVELDVTGGTTYTNMGTQQMMSVPYALYAAKANNAGPQGPSGALGAYGDGSAGELNVGAGLTFDISNAASYNFQYSKITVAASGTLIVPSGITLRVTGNVSISGTIRVLTGTSDNGAQRSHPGVAISPSGYPYGGTGLTTVAASGLVKIPLYGGGSGTRNTNTTGGEGGGSLRILSAGSITVASGGVVQANGSAGVNTNTAGLGIPGAGGGAGGVIVLMGKTGVTVSGAIQANGASGSSGFDGNGGNSEGGGGGGGGGIIILASSATPAITGTIQVNGGAAGSLAGAGATVNIGGGGGACGGNGGNGGITSTASTAGNAGKSIQIVAATPENLTL